MNRPTRIQFPSATYHVTSRGNRRAPIYLDRRDFLIWLDLLAGTVEKHAVKVHGYCLMPNHYHLLIETPNANLSKAIHMLNARYCQHFNKRHHVSGHVIQGRFHAILIKSDRQLQAVSRYMNLNPLRARLVRNPSEWPWSSYPAYLAPENAPNWLETERVLSEFGDIADSTRSSSYQSFVLAGLGAPNPLRFHGQRPNARREQALSLQEYAEEYADRTEAMARALQSTAYTRQEIAEFFGVSTRTISRAATIFPAADG
ncbi:REP-associated tyrosine transposase [Pseudoduganella violaceinigra]|uniref:REP-associated tyrosine transposase n=1 Tax=Pseudoduganella violaceinigra TaxID=246602 RepID=UPI00047FC1EE|nr:transposase [Pseudoduganella violaceinigra]